MMILEKEKVAANGAMTKYHVIDAISVSSSQLKCHMESYVDLPYIAIKKPINYDFLCFIITKADLATPILELVLNKLNELEEWNGVQFIDETVIVEEESDEVTETTDPSAVIEEETE